jgi:UrcA family protein
MKTLTLAALAAATLAAAPAFAQSGGPRIAVSVADLDLATAEGREALDLRLLHAGRTACGTPSPADPHGAANLERCVADARAAAAAQRDAVIALASRRSGTVVAANR